MEECRKCCYFGYSDNPDWIKADGTKIEHCLYHEIHGEFDDNAPCNYNEPEETGSEWDWEDF